MSNELVLPDDDSPAGDFVSLDTIACADCGYEPKLSWAWEGIDPALAFACRAAEYLKREGWQMIASQPHCRECAATCESHLSGESDPALSPQTVRRRQAVYMLRFVVFCTLTLGTGLSILIMGMMKGAMPMLPLVFVAVVFGYVTVLLAFLIVSIMAAAVWLLLLRVRMISNSMYAIVRFLVEKTASSHDRQAT